MFSNPRSPRPREEASVLQEQPAASVQQPHRPPAQFQQLPVVPRVPRPTSTTPSILQSTPAAPIRQPHLHPQPFDQMQFQRGQGAARSTSAPTRPPASTTFIPSELARQGRVELESFPQAPNVASQPTLLNSIESTRQRRPAGPAVAAEAPSRSSPRPLTPVAPPAALPGFHQHQTVPGAILLTATPPVVKETFTQSPRLPGIVPPIRVPNHPRTAAPGPARYLVQVDSEL